MVKFTNTSNFSISVKGFGWIESGESVDVKEDNPAINTFRGIESFKEGASSAKKKKSSKSASKSE